MKIFFIVNDLGVNEPFGPMILSAVVKKEGHTSEFGSIKIDKDLIDRIVQFDPDVIAYSMMTADLLDMREFNDNLRNRLKVFTIIGGPSTYDYNLITDNGIDAICIGEGETALVKVLDNLEHNRNIDDTPNILTKIEDKDKLSLESLNSSLDEIPFMDREIVYRYPNMARFGIKGIWTSRGCAFRCPYCFNNRFNDLYRGKGKIVRRRSVSDIIKETIELRDNYRTDIIRIQDDIFVYKVDDWLKEFSDRWPKEVGVPFYALLRLEYITEELAYYLKKAGCCSVCVSVESADDNIRNDMLRRNMSKEKMEEGFLILKKHNLAVYNNIMFALPFTSIEDDIESVDFAIKVKPDLPDFSIFMPYPGTDLGDYCREVGIYDHESDNIYYGFGNESPLKCFDDKTKRAQYNLAQLAIFIVKVPVFRDLVVKHLIYWRPNKIFFIINYLFSVHAYGTKIFPYKHSISDYIFLIKKTLSYYSFEYFSKKKKNKADNIFTMNLPTLSRSSVPVLARSSLPDLSRSSLLMDDDSNKKSSINISTVPVSNITIDNEMRDIEDAMTAMSPRRAKKKAVRASM